MAKNLWEHIQSVRQESPLVHNITNFVVMNNSANAVLAIGASPIMTHSHSEVIDMVNICHSLVINIGTLDEYFVETMLLSAMRAKALRKPWVLDSVGTGTAALGQEYVHEAIYKGQNVLLGKGNGPLNHFFNPHKLIKHDLV